MSSVWTIMSMGLKDEIRENEYSKTFEVAIKDKYFNKDNIEEYFKIDYYDKDNFINNNNKLLNKGYLVADINIINANNSSEVIEEIVSNDYNKRLVNFMEFDFYKDTNLYRYVDYYTGDYEETVVQVNIGLDTEYYSNPETIKDYSTTVLANKYHQLDENYVPTKLTQIKAECSNGKQYLSKEAQEAFESMCNAAMSEGMNIKANSAYRSYEDQQEVYDTYLGLYGQNYVNNYVALPGYSEHQTGLSLDIMQEGYNIFVSSPGYKWMTENAHKYGFILRYPSGKEDITGYKNEPWHYRYVGVELATEVYNSNLTYEEYYIKNLDK